MSPFFRPGPQGGGRYRMVLVIRVAMLVVLLLATFILHVSGTALVELRIARLAIFVALAVGVGWVSRAQATELHHYTPRRRSVAPASLSASGWRAPAGAVRSPSRSR